MRKGAVFFNKSKAGVLTEDDNGYTFQYDVEYLSGKEATPISLTLPLSVTPYQSNILFPFFDGLIPEGWLLDITAKNWKLDPSDRMALLLTCCENCIGAVSIKEIKETEP